MRLSAFIKRVREHTGQHNPKIIFTTLNTSTEKLNSGSAVGDGVPKEQQLSIESNGYES